MLKSLVKNLKLTLLLCCVVFRRVVYGKATRSVGVPRKIVIAQFSKLGDMVCTTPMFRAVKEHFPEVKLYVIGNATNKFILDENKDVDHYFIYNHNFFRLLLKLKTEQADFACMCAPNFIGLALLFLAGIPCITTPKVSGGWSPLETWWFRVIRRYVILKTHTMGQYAPREYLRLLEPIGIFTDNTTKYLSFSAAAAGDVDKLFIEYKIDFHRDLLIGIIPSAGNKIKQWSPLNFAAVADYLIFNYDAKIFLVGSQADRMEADETEKYIKIKNRVYNLAGKLNIDQLKCFISHLNMLVGVDTGPIYIAEAFGVATVDIVGPMDENEQPPRGSSHRIVVSPIRKKSAIHIMNARSYDSVEAKKQVDLITADMVISTMRDLMYNLHLVLK